MFLEDQPDLNTLLCAAATAVNGPTSTIAAGTITALTDPYGGITRFTRGRRTGRVTKEVDPNGNITQLLYDGVGRHYARRHPLGHVVADHWDEDPDSDDPLSYVLPKRRWNGSLETCWIPRTSANLVTMIRS